MLTLLRMLPMLPMLPTLPTLPMPSALKTIPSTQLNPDSDPMASR